MDAHPLSAGGVVVDVPVLDRVVEDRGESTEHLADRRRPERHGAPPAPVADVGSGGERLAQLL
ncbi:MAG TPA: hypothetical protein VHU14_00180 [Solirubrobacterales bacterium]|nr:hypothetical protein [Solirubrobacterales bacterium]